MSETRTILITGCAGFIGMHLAEYLLNEGNRVIGLDNLNTYYSRALKIQRLRELGLKQNQILDNKLVWANDAFGFIKTDVRNTQILTEVFKENGVCTVFHLAGQAGVRYSTQNPKIYIDTNVGGTTSVLEACRNLDIGHLYLASSSSVYGGIGQVPFTEDMNCNLPVSVYAASKGAAELVAHAYHNLYDLNISVLRFFTVYGPWDRPDMALSKFVKAALSGEKIDIYNGGDMKRDFTFIGDLVEILGRLLEKPPLEYTSAFRILNVGTGMPVALGSFIKEIEHSLGCTVQKAYQEMQLGDVQTTFADTKKLESIIGELPRTSLQDGVKAAVNWHIRNNYKQ